LMTAFKHVQDEFHPLPNVQCRTPNDG
jgi:hypothetical protein